MPLRVLQVSPYYYPEVKFGGPPRKMLGLAKSLMAAGCEVGVVTFRSDDRHAAGTRLVDGVNIQYLPWCGWATRQFASRTGALRKAVAEADLVHAFGLYNFLSPLAARLAREYGRPFVIEPQGNYRPQTRNQLLKRAYHRVFTQRMFADAAAVIATSPAEKEELAAAVAPARLFVRANGIEPPETLGDAAGARSRLGLAVDDFVLLFLGRISPIKNLEMLVRSIAEADLPRARLLLVGPLDEADYVTRIRHLIAALRMEERVQLLGPRYGADKVDVYAASDLFVLPSFSESYGNAIAEAVAVGLPILITDTCGIAPVVHEIAGLAVPCSGSAFSAGLRQMAESASRTRYSGAWQKLADKLSWAEPLSAQLSIYEKVMAGFPGMVAN